MGTHARMLKSFYQHFFLPDPYCSPSSENKRGDVRGIVQDKLNRPGSWWPRFCQVNLIFEDFLQPDLALQRAESKPYALVGASSYCWGGVVHYSPATVI